MYQNQDETSVYILHVKYTNDTRCRRPLQRQKRVWHGVRRLCREKHTQQLLQIAQLCVLTAARVSRDTQRQLRALQATQCLAQDRATLQGLLVSQTPRLCSDRRRRGQLMKRSLLLRHTACHCVVHIHFHRLCLVRLL